MNSSVKNGLFFFAVSAVITLLQYFFARESLFSPLLMTVVPLVLSIVFIIKAIRDDRGDDSGYSLGEGIKAGMICFGIGSFLFAVFGVLLYNYVDPSLVETGIEMTKELQVKTVEKMTDLMGADEATKADMMAELAKQGDKNPYSIYFQGLGWVGGLIFPGIIASLIAAAVMKRT